ncbi:hypothetical protein H1S01_10615 [Heliobacterium chlorum]|uniref:Uncharacterized protein n=1 Tax=Heliobacterium chlorum TaxID=2698 RepID=A0ABR7T2G8_HELCL|nr:hypothetical protein [Heliobacterium chlorum]MBC9784963.1 hypothetical protein [Heliobacterium chlorum]
MLAKRISLVRYGYFPNYTQVVAFPHFHKVKRSLWTHDLTEACYYLVGSVITAAMTTVTMFLMYYYL